MAGFAPSAVVGAGSGATVGVFLLGKSAAPASHFSTISFPASRGVGGAPAPLVSERTKALLPAAAAKVGVVLCSPSLAESSTEVVAGRGLLSLSVPEGTAVGWGILPAAKLLVSPVRCSGIVAGSPSEDMTGTHGVLSLSVPEGTKAGWGILPVPDSKLRISLVHCSGSPPSPTFAEEFRALLDEIPLKLNCLALVGHQDILDDLADSAAIATTFIGTFTPAMVDMASHPDRRLEVTSTRTFVQLLKMTGLDIATAVEMVRAESTEGYIREESLFSAIVKVRECTYNFPAKSNMLPPPYAGTVPPSAKSDRVAYFKALASEFHQICVFLEMALKEA